MNKTALALYTTLSILASVVFTAEAPAAPQINRTYEWTVEIDTQDLPNQFQYRGSSISQVIKTQMKYYSMNNAGAATAYEDLWYANAKSLGMERHNKLGTNAGDAIAIRVLHTGSKPLSPSHDEQRAAGKAVMKAIVDAMVNRNMVATIKVPMVSFQTISSEIQNYNFTPVSTSDGVETQLNSDINLFLESEPAGLTQSFAHYH